MLNTYQPRLTHVTLGILLLVLITACAPLTEDERFAMEYQSVERQEAIRSFIRSCESAGYTVYYAGPSYPKLQDPVKRIPRHAHQSDYSCN